MKFTTEIFKEKAREVHGDKFNYDKVDYKNSSTKVTITCPTHGDFEQVPSSHLSGVGCRGCQYAKPSVKKNSEESVLQKFKEVHGDKYDYSKFKYQTAKTKSTIICKEHGEFEQRPQNHMRGEGCPACGKAVGRAKKTQEQFLKECKDTHGERYDYSKVVYNDANSNVIIICKEHGEFEQTPNQHLKGHGCNRCSYEERGRSRRMDVSEIKKVINKFLKENNYKLKSSYPKLAEEKFDVICPDHGEFLTNFRKIYYSNNQCPKCSDIISKGELEVKDFVESLGFQPILSDRSILGGKELDILIKEKNLAIEYNGVTWHSDKHGRGPSYHLDKTTSAKSKGISLIHIFEDEWLNQKEIVKSIIANKLGVVNKISSLECDTKEISDVEASKFLISTHLKGAVSGGVFIGLFFKGDLVSVMGVKEVNRGLRTFEISRIAKALNLYIIDGTAKMLNHFETNYNPNILYASSDRRYSEGDSYIGLGFDFYQTLIPDYMFVKNGGKRIEKAEVGISEWGYHRIYDCGINKYIKTY